MSGELKTSHAFALLLTLVLGFFTFINWANQQFESISYTSPSTQLAQVSLLSNRTVPPDPEQNFLIIYNSNPLVPESALIKEYYINNRPGISKANVLGININKTATQYDNISSLDYINQADFNTKIRDPITTWFQSHPEKSIKYIAVMYGVPTRVTDLISSGSVDYRIFQNTSAFVTRIDMGTVPATEAYIDKLVTMCNCRDNPKVIISPENSGNGGTTYYFDEARGKYESYTVHSSLSALLAENPSALTLYSSNLGLTTPNHIFTASDVKGYMTWGANGSLGPDYANNGYVKFSGKSNWYIIETIESWNGQRIGTGCPGSCQGNFVDWFASNAFGSTNYENTPVGAVTHVSEPGLGGVNSPDYFRLWEHGYLFSEAAWASRMTEHFMAVGDPFVSVQKNINDSISLPTNQRFQITTFDFHSSSGGRSVTVPLDQSVTLIWSSTNTTSCTGSGGTFSGEKSKSGTETVWPTVNTTYSLDCRGLGKSNIGSGPSSIVKNIYVTIGEPVLPLYVVNITKSGSTGSGTVVCDPSSCSVKSGSSITLTATPASGSTFSGWSGCIAPTINPNVCTLTLDSHKTINARFMIPSTSTVTPTVTSFTATPTSITSGQSATLSWSSTGAISCNASDGWTGIKTTSGTQTVTPTVTTTYGISCSGGGVTSIRKNVTVTVPNTPTVTSFTATPTSITSGQSATLEWSSTDAVSCTGSGGTFSGGKYTSGTQTVTPTVNTTYGITCTGGGSTSMIKNVTITVTPVGDTTYTVEKSIEGTGSGTITCNPISCITTTGSVIILTANPALGSRFTGWSNGCTGVSTCTISSASSPIATFTSIPGDFNSDGRVNATDFSSLTGDWNKSNSPYDLNKDGIVNTLDYVIMVQGWTG